MIQTDVCHIHSFMTGFNPPECWLIERRFAMRQIFSNFCKRRKTRSVRSVQLSVLKLEERAVPATFIVTSNGDNGAGTLRDALSMANGSPGADTIKFSIGSGQATIALASGLPDVSDAVTIDATTQPGYAGTPVIELNGANAGSSVAGFKITSGLVTIKGLIINRFSSNCSSSYSNSNCSNRWCCASSSRCSSRSN